MNPAERAEGAGRVTKSELSATPAINTTQSEPTARCAREPFTLANWNTPSRKAAMAATALTRISGSAWSRGVSDMASLRPRYGDD
jgi:hypothetical protein